MNNHLVSIVVPVYNAFKYLEKCIDSIISQSYNNIEIILVDDGSKDNSGQICDTYAKKDNRVVVFHTDNKGVSSARNTGIKHANGTYLMFIDSDDYVEKDYVLKFVNAVNLGYDYAQCNFNICIDDKVNKEIIIKEDKELSNINEIKYAIFSLKYGSCHNLSNSRCSCGKIYNLNIIKNNNIRFDEKIYLLEDGLFNLEYIKYCDKCYLISDCLYNYCQISTSSSHRYNENQLEQYSLVEKKLKEYVLNDMELDYYYVACYQHLLTFISRNIRFNNKKKKNVNDIKNICSKNYKNVIKSVKYNELFNSEKIILFLLRRRMYNFIYFGMTLRDKIIKK